MVSVYLFNFQRQQSFRSSHPPASPASPISCLGIPSVRRVSAGGRSGSWGRPTATGGVRQPPCPSAGRDLAATDRQGCDTGQETLARRR